MTSRTLLPAVAFLVALSRLEAAPISFPAGTFEGGTSSQWATQSTGLASASTPSEAGNTFGRVAITGIGSGSLSTSVASPFQATSLYVVSVDLRSSTLVSLASQSFELEVLDGNCAVVASLDQSQLVGVLGTNLGVVSELTGGLSGLLGRADLIGVLQPLLELLQGDSALLGAVEQLIDSLIGADPSVVSELVALLQQVLAGTLDPATLDLSDIASLLDLPEASPIVAAVDQFLDFTVGNDGPVEAVLNLLQVLLGGAPGDTALVQELLAALVGDEGLVERVADILLYALADDGLLGSLTETLTRSLLGVANPNESGFQTVKLIFSVGSTPPEGAIGIRLSAAATVALGAQVDYDNVTIERFALVTPPGPGGPGIVGRPSVNIRGKKLRPVKGNRMVIRGKATAVGADNRITRVEYNVRGKSVKSKKFRKAKGAENWRFVVRPKDPRTRIRVRAVDSFQQKSPKRVVALVK
jgi:hypothetical protein